jgi:hypothetical protein
MQVYRLMMVSPKAQHLSPIMIFQHPIKRQPIVRVLLADDLMIAIDYRAITSVNNNDKRENRSGAEH